MDNADLAPADQKRIRDEEVYRAAVRRQLESEGQTNYRWRLANSPLVIWLLSSVVLGLASFVYNQSTRQQSERASNEDKATAVFFEAHFRMKQMDTVLAQAKADPPSSTLQLFVGIKLGGIVSFPLSDEATVWVNSSGTGNRALPSGRGFQNQEFYGYSLLNLWYRYHTLTCGDRPPSVRVAKLAGMLQELDSIVRTEANAGEAATIVRQVDDAWTGLRSVLAVFVEPGPNVECPGLDDNAA